MKQITHNELAAILGARKGAVILGIISNTDAKALKTGNPHAEIRKVTRQTVVTGADYQAAVEKQGGQGFKAEGMSYGEFVIEKKVIRGPKGDLQLRTVARNPRKPSSVVFLADGKPVEKREIEAFLPKRKGSAKQAAAGVVGKKQVIVRNFSFDNIEQVRLGGEVFKLVKG
jgi:hypothetical protein